MDRIKSTDLICWKSLYNRWSIKCSSGIRL